MHVGTWRAASAKNQPQRGDITQTGALAPVLLLHHKAN